MSEAGLLVQYNLSNLLALVSWLLVVLILATSDLILLTFDIALLLDPRTFP